MASIRVRATRIGYYDLKRRYPADHPKGSNGRDVFDLVDIPIFDKKTGKKTGVIPAEKQFSEKWMERVDAATPGKKQAPAEVEDVKSTGDAEVI